MDPEFKWQFLAKSGPLDFATKNSFPLFFVCEKGLVHMYQNHFIYFPILYFCFATSQKPILPLKGVSSGDQKAEIYGFWEARYDQLNAVYEILLWLSI